MKNIPAIYCWPFWKGVGTVLIVLASFSGCYRPIPTQEPILAYEQMVPVLKDIHLAEAMLVEVQDQRAKDSLARLYYAQIFALYRIDSADFEQSYKAYLGNPPALDSLYRDVVQLLEKERRETAGPPPAMDPID